MYCKKRTLFVVFDDFERGDAGVTFDFFDEMRLVVETAEVGDGGE